MAWAPSSGWTPWAASDPGTTTVRPAVLPTPTFTLHSGTGQRGLGGVVRVGVKPGQYGWGGQPIEKAAQVFVQETGLDGARDDLRRLEDAGASVVTFILHTEHGPGWVRRLGDTLGLG